jgi:predicted kinase
MLDRKPVLHMMCGKIASGKSTLCAQLAQAPSTIIIAQDHWMSKLYPVELTTVADYIRLVPRLRAAMGPHIIDLLRIGISVILDWPANTVTSRAWMRSLCEAAGAAHQLHILEVPGAVCLERLRKRNLSGGHEYDVSQAEFDEITRLFEPPTAAENLDSVIYPWR